MTWDWFLPLVAQWIPSAKILHPHPNVCFDATYLPCIRGGRVLVGRNQRSKSWRGNLPDLDPSYWPVSGNKGLGSTCAARPCMKEGYSTRSEERRVAPIICV